MTTSGTDLHHTLQGLFAERRRALLAGRQNDWAPGFDPRTAAIRQADWQVAPPPAELRARLVEQLVEPSDAAAIQAALSAGPDALIFDFDDTFAPTPENVRAGHANLRNVPRAGGPLPMTRPRPLYMEDENGQSASLQDLAAYVEAFADRETLYVYIPKLEFPAEAEFWNDLLTETERLGGRQPGSIRVCIQIETLPGAFYADELLYALRDRAFGLNAGRWDYVFSAIKWLGQDRRFCLPERGELNMGQPSMQAYEQNLARVCARRGAQAIGGTAALAPDPADPEPALAVVRADKEREASQGYVAAWAGLPGLIPTVRAVFQSAPPASPPAPRTEEEVAAELLAFPRAEQVPLSAVREAVAVTVTYFRAWLAGQGFIVRNNRVEDTATAELARAQLWQWVQHRIPLDDGEALTPERFEALLAEQADGQEPAARLLRALVLPESCPPFFPATARSLHEVPLA
ncbi:malate synthase A (plasmid) [Deinococcus metallilatus]|uniref:malate synthase n=1 Tax=Deinococcus metallilatus TaxID=1211322 RepID=A0AAJ5F7L9_9DEIO|nr:malate synthase A [Deinococcus metallilatus]MBB5293216.1 malate synthase [Deinococcus metallilatus]QBY07004.1 malate synthase A [Deinococcus metallilatus]RXJ18015.1 malate synthase A [Deinococcus metallilatus]TLK31951.1 malate synthase A [Deinococcus metallilatus]GMA15561.1 malate synthase A [Deinococcus metallilatus]